MSVSKHCIAPIVIGKQSGQEDLHLNNWQESFQNLSIKMLVIFNFAQKRMLSSFFPITIYIYTVTEYIQ